MTRYRCGGCGADQLFPVLDMGITPLADRFPATSEELEPMYPLAAVVCARCWLMQLDHIVPDTVLWDSEYAFYAGSSPALVEDNARLAIELQHRWPDGPVVEVACNDGDLLRRFASFGRKSLGVDPAPGPVAVARDRGLDVMQLGFGRTVAERIVADQGKAGLIIARNVVAHVANLGDFFGGLRELVADDGAVVLEFQYLGDLLAGCQFDHLYHEHRQFFSVYTLATIARGFGFYVDHVQHVPAQGGSIRLELRRGDELTESAKLWLVEEADLGLQSMASYQSFANRARYIRARLNDILTGPMLHMDVAGYAASAKSCTLLNWIGAGPDLLSYVEDTTPAKVGRYTPGTKILIESPEYREEIRPDAFLLLAWNYLPGVLRRERTWMAGGGRMLVPIPMPVLL